jgi:hypothetical protein
MAERGLPGTSALGGALAEGLGRFFLQPDALDLGVVTAGGTKLKVDGFPAHEFRLTGAPVEAYVTPMAYLDLVSTADPATVLNTSSVTAPTDTGPHGHTVALPFVWKPLADGERVLVGWIGDEPNRQPVVISRLLRYR